MLTIEDVPTIKNAIIKRLDKEYGVKVMDVGVREMFKPHRIEIQITSLVHPIPTVELEDILRVNSGITAPPQFAHDDLLNEIDQIAEQYKQTRRDYLNQSHNILNSNIQLAGQGKMKQ